MQVIRGQFYGDCPERWHKDQHFIKERFVLWPAAWLHSRGVTLSAMRYREILLDVLDDVKRHGSTGVVRHWPGYLTHCIQEHFRHHEDEIYEEGKAVRTVLDRTLKQVNRARSTADPLAPLAAAHAVLMAKRVARRRPRAQSTQTELFNL